MENDEEEKIVKVDESEMPGDPRRFRITKEDIERVVFRWLCWLQFRRRVQDDLRSTEDGRERVDKAEERFNEALVRAGERMESIGMRVAMNLKENRGNSIAAQAEDS